jgi:hypothetical protein
MPIERRRNASSRAFPRPGASGPSAADNPALQLAWRVAPEVGGLQRGRAIGKTNEVGPVTVNAMAELTHRDFLSKAPAGLVTHSQARP